MRLTICLVTRGRSSFLDECLESLRQCLKTDMADVLVFDNGAPALTSARLEEWCDENHVERIRFEENDSSPTSVWNVLTSRQVEWVVFPGDDDVFIPDSIRWFRQEANNADNAAAIAFNLSLIDSNSRDLHITRTPQFNEDQPQHIAMAQSLHEPQFLWPSLFFRASLIIDRGLHSLPTSRFYFDWWVGQQLLMFGDIIRVNRSSIKYRVHDLQESNLANPRRKFFEATYWTLQMIESRIFVAWIRNLTENELSEFWDELLSQQPIYSNDFFGAQVIMKIGQLIVNENRSLATIERVIGTLAAYNGVYLKNGEAYNLMNIHKSPSERGSASNLFFILAPGTCISLTSAVSLFFESHSAAKAFRISCKHSDTGTFDFEYDCKDARNLDPDQIADSLIMQASFLAEARGELDFIVTAIERNFVIKLRALKRRIPGVIFRIVKRIFEKMVKRK